LPLFTFLYLNFSQEKFSQILNIFVLLSKFKIVRYNGPLEKN